MYSNLRANLKGEENDEFCQDLPSSRSVNSLKSTLEKGKESESEYSKDTIQQSSEMHKMVSSIKMLCLPVFIRVFYVHMYC